MRYIELCDIVSASFVFCADANINSIPLSSIEEYGRRVVDFLNNEENSSEPITYLLKLSPERTKSFFEQANCYFTYNKESNIVTLNEWVGIDVLYTRFLSILPQNVVNALKHEVFYTI